MATNDWDDDDDFDFEDNQTQADVNQETKRFKDLRKAKRADEKRIKELTEQLEVYNKAQREETVKKVLDQKGVNPKAARLILKDLDTVNEESVSNWLDDNGDLFGFVNQSQANPEQQIDLAALRQQDIVTQGGTTPDRQMDAEQRINDATSADEIIRMIQSGQF